MQTEPVAIRSDPIHKADHRMSRDQMFPYGHLIEGSIRLLQTRSDAEGIMSYKLTDYTLSKDLEFVALSYAWGTEKATIAIYCNEVPLFVTPHLHKALNCMHWSGQQDSRLMWIDTICINQSDESEKQMQLQLMGDIYKFASTVCVWLGSSTDDDVSAINAISEIVNILKNVDGQIRLTEQSLSELSLPAVNDRIWSSFGSLFTRSWFERLWTVQEMALAKEIIFRCGTSIIRGSDMIDFAESLRSTGLVALTRGSSIPKAGTTDSYHFPTLIRRFTETRTSDKGVPLDLLFQLVRSRKATLPVDKVYGVMGLAEERVRLKITEIPHGTSLPKGYHNLYIAVGKICLREYPELRLLAMQPSKVLCHELPSWCPNLNSEPEASPFFYEYYTSGTSRNLSETASPKLSRMLRFEGDIMIIQGWLIGTISEAAKSSEKWDNEPGDVHDYPKHTKYTSEWMNECLNLAQRVTDQHNIIPEAYLRTIIADIFNTQPGETPEVLREAYRLLGIYQADLMHNRTPSINHSEELLVLRFMDSIYHASRYRRVFAIGNRLCLGPDQVQIGDAIAVFPEANMPFVLRQQGTDPTYRLVGPAYVRGLMQGQVFDLMDSKEVKRRVFEIA